MTLSCARLEEGAAEHADVVLAAVLRVLVVAKLFWALEVRGAQAHTWKLELGWGPELDEDIEDRLYLDR